MALAIDIKGPSSKMCPQLQAKKTKVKLHLLLIHEVYYGGWKKLDAMFFVDPYY